VEILEKLENSFKDFGMKTGESPAVVIIHPDHREAIGDIKEYMGIKIYIPNWNELDMVGFMCGVSSKDARFWNRDHAYLMDQDAWDRITKVGKTPNILDYSGSLDELKV
jgi:hypothetical protein